MHRSALAILLLSLMLPGAAIPAQVSLPAAHAGSGAPISINRTTSSPAIDGTITQQEWGNALRLNISPAGTGSSFLYLLFNGTHLFAAVDAVSDTSETPGTPSGLVGGAVDYFMASLDGEDDGDVTYTDTMDDGLPSHEPITRQGGVVRDRGAVIYGGGDGRAGWWLRAGWDANLHLFYENGSPNLGTGDPYDYIARGFGASPNSNAGHRMYEFGIPYGAGPNGELGAVYGDTVGLAVVVNDGATGTYKGVFPAGADGIGAPFGRIELRQRPVAVITSPLPGLRVVDGTTVAFNGSASASDAPLTWRWDFGDGDKDESNRSVTAHNYTGPGNFTAVLTVVDADDSAEARANVTVTVVEREQAPEILSSAPDERAVSILENGTVRFSITYDDPNLDRAGESLDVAWVVNGARQTTDVDVAGRTSNFTFRADYSSAEVDGGRYAVRAVVTDSYNCSGLYDGPRLNATAEWNLTVLNRNRPPVVLVAVPDPDTAVRTNETTRTDFSVTAADPDNETLKFNWSLDGVMVQSGTNGSFAYLALPDFSSAGSHALAVIVRDGAGGEASVRWNMTVQNSNRPPVITSSSPASPATTDEGRAISFNIQATDGDGDALSYQWVLGPADREPSALPGERGPALTFTPAYDGALSSADSPLRVRVRAGDGVDAAEWSWYLIVRNTNRPPAASINAPTGGAGIPVGENYTFDGGNSSDPDGPVTLSYLWDFGDGTPAVAGAGLARPFHAFAAPGNYTVTLTVRDGDLANSTTLRVHVAAAVVAVSRVWSSHERPTAGMNITLGAALVNTGDLEAGDVTVRFYRNETTAAGLLGTVQLPEPLRPGEGRNVTLPWAPPAGEHRIIVEVVKGKRMSGVTGGEMTLNVLPPVVNGGNPHLQGSGDASLLIAGGVLAAAVAAAGAAVALRRRHSPGGKARSDAAAPGAERAGTARAGSRKERRGEQKHPSPEPAPEPVAKPPEEPGATPAVAPAAVPAPEPDATPAPVPQEPPAPAPAPASEPEPAPPPLPPPVSSPEHSPAVQEPPEKAVGATPTEAAAPTASGPRCSACGKEVNPSWPICPACDSPLQVTAAQKAVCPNCGKEVKEGWTLCPFCDTPLAPAAPKSGEAERRKKRIHWGEEAKRVGGAAGPDPGDGPAERAQRAIRRAEESITGAKARGADTRKAENLLGLARSFLNDGNFDKAAKYSGRAVEEARR